MKPATPRQRPQAVANAAPDVLPVRLLVVLAAAIWTLSLLLPGYFVDGDDGNAISGLDALGLGLCYGWAAAGWAAYANLLFVAAGTWLLMGRRGTGLVIAMLLLMSTLLIYNAQPTGTGPSEPVTAWGLGAVAWVVALGTMAMACATRLAWQSGPARTLNLLGAAVVLVVIGAGSLIGHPIARPSGLGPDLVSQASPCGIALTWAKDPVVPRGEIVALDVDPALAHPGANGRPAIEPIALIRYQQGDTAWDTDGFGETGMSVRMPAQPRRYTLQMRATPTGAVLRVLDAQSTHPLYEQRLETYRASAGQVRLCPGNVPASRGYANALLLAVNQADSSFPIGTAPLHADAPTESCDPSPEDIGHGARPMHHWDGRDVERDWYVDGAIRGFCSADYAVLVTLTHSQHARNEVRTSVQIYDRRTLRKVGAFAAGQIACGSQACLDTDPAFITGVRFDEHTATLSTRDGDWTIRGR